MLSFPVGRAIPQLDERIILAAHTYFTLEDGQTMDFTKLLLIILRRPRHTGAARLVILAVGILLMARAYESLFRLDDIFPGLIDA